MSMNSDPGNFDDARPPTLLRRRRRSRVLVVNDVRAERDLYSAHLRRAGFDVQEAADGFEALARAVAGRPDAIVTDVAVPNLDAWELTRRLKAAAATRDIPVIAVGTHDPVGGTERARAAGCAASLFRPFRPEDVRAERGRAPARRGPSAAAAPGSGGPHLTLVPSKSRFATADRKSQT